MGLDTTHDAWHGAYSSFGRWRTWLAEKIGLNLHDMEGYCIGGIPWDTVEDDLKIILNHSDCDGILTSEECGLLAARLTELIGNNIIKEEIHDFDNDEDWNYLKLKQFRDGCVKANKRKQIMEFQ